MTTALLPRVGLLLACALLLGVPQAFAERYALLVGVSDYAANAATGGSLNLEGPAEDVPALRRVLLERHGFADRNVVALVNAAATRQAILDRLTGLVGAMRDGDYLLFYFSGHGTSAFDAKMQPVSAFIGPNSGALAPHDLAMDTPERAAASLLIGRRDLRPILERLPKGSTALVILDACYSENSVRSIRQRTAGKARGIALVTLAAGATSGSGSASAALSSETAAAERLYPYSNVFALTAASKDEQARDIDRNMLVDGKYPTIDGKPHGAFTNSLLEGLAGAGDRDRNGTITMQELYDFSRRSVQARFSHTPQLLAPASAALTGVAAFGAAPQTGLAGGPACQAGAASAASGSVRVRLDGVEPGLTARFAASPGIQVVATGGDLVVSQGPGGLLDLYDRSGTLIRQFRASEASALVARAGAEPALTRLIEDGAGCQAFNASVRLTPGGQSRFSPRDRMGIEAVLDRPAHLVLFNIDKSGTVSLVYPVTAAERTKQPAGRALALASVRAVAPFGSEHLKLVAFATEPPLAQLGCRIEGGGNLQCPDIQPGTPSFEALLRLIDASPAAESHVRFTTYEE